jgi:type II secretory pathway pseudopilin PulG
LSATEDTKKEDTTNNNEIIDKDTLIYVGAGAGLLGLVGVIAMAGMGWMKEQDQEKKRAELLKQQQMRQQVALEMRQRQMQQQQQQQDQGWPSTIPRNTIQQRPPSPVMELPSDVPEDTDGYFVGSSSPTTAYNTNEQQRFVVSDDIVNTHRYPVIDPHAPTQQIGNKISRVMSLDDYPNQRQQSQYQQQQQNSSPPPPIRTNNSVGDDEDISDIF